MATQDTQHQRTTHIRWWSPASLCTLLPAPFDAIGGFIWRLTLAALHMTLVFALVMVITVSWLYHHYSQYLPDPRDIGRFRSFETTRIYANDGQTLLYEVVDPHGGHRTSIAFDHIPSIVKDATIAVEDANFYTHPGVDYRGVIRAMWLNYQEQSIVSGGSTITQQLVRNILFLPEELSRDVDTVQLYERKVREMILAYEVTKYYSKDQILNLYLNQVYYGAQAYGIEAAAQVYFGKHVWQLTRGEATLLAGLPQSPTVYNPFNNLPAARARQRITINLMVTYGYLTPSEADAIYQEPINVVVPESTLVAPHFVFYVRDIVEQMYGKQLLYRGGLRVVTTLDMHWQAEAQRIAQEHIANLVSRNAHNAAVVMLSPAGDVLAMVGSVNYYDAAIDGQVNVALAPRQPGSALKPIIYAATLHHGWTPATVIWDTPTQFVLPDGTIYAPLNYDNSWHGPQRLRMALANSLNIPAVKALEFVGIDEFVQLATHMGITTLRDPTRYGLSMALGSNEVRLLDLSVAYHTFRNGGFYQPANAIRRVENSRGDVLVTPHQEPQQVLGRFGEQIAFLITDILRDNAARRYMFGYGNVMELPNGIDAAVKTGTSNDWRDSWAMGYTSDVTIGVWVGNSDSSPMQEIAGSNGAGYIWRDVMIAYHAGHTPQPFTPPAGIVQRTICAGTGTLATSACPLPMQEYFIEGVEPPESQITYRTVRVAGDGSCLAASYSPPQEIHNAQFAIYPPEFSAWAANNGVPQPPTELCPPPSTPDEAVALLMPVGGNGMVNEAHVSVYGTARYGYRLDIGAGTQPTTWMSLNQSWAGGRNTLLGTWHTSGFVPGEYTIRLTVTTPEGLEIAERMVVWLQPAS